jgi:uncharacterized protein (UPF0332 family)
MAQGMKVSAQIRFKHAKESLEDAKNLIVQDVGANFVMNSVYYSIMFSIFGLLEARGIPAPAQDKMISIFEREYVTTGRIETRFLDGIRKVFELRPACDCQGKKKVTVKDVEELLPIADEFLALAERLAE